MNLLFWLVFCALLATMQGRLLPAVRRTPPGEEAQQQAFALHYIGAAAYLLPVVLNASWLFLATALVVRVLLFDPIINASSGVPLFYVGQTALMDKLIRRAAPAKPERFRLYLSLFILAAASLLLLLFANTASLLR